MGKYPAILTPQLAQEAIECLKPFIESLIKKQDRVAVHIVVLASLAPDTPEATEIWEESIGEQDKLKWNGEYDKRARLKAKITARTKAPAHMIIRAWPHLITKGDFKYGGSDYRNGIIVGVSGLPAWEHDYMIAACVTATIDALCTKAVETQLANKESLFFE